MVHIGRPHTSLPYTGGGGGTIELDPDLDAIGDLDPGPNHLIGTLGDGSWAGIPITVAWRALLGSGDLNAIRSTLKYIGNDTTESVDGVKTFIQAALFQAGFTVYNQPGDTSRFILYNSNANQGWEIGANTGGVFSFWDATNGKGPFKIYPNADDDALVIGVGTTWMSQQLDMEANKIVDVADGTNPQDAVTRAQLDGKRAAFPTGTVATPIGTADKTVTIAGHTPAAGDILDLTFTNGSSVGAPTLAVNGGTARPIRTPSGITSASSTALTAGARVLLHFDGTNYSLLGATQNTTYAEISGAGIIDTAGSTGALITGRRAEDLMVNEASKARTLVNKTLSNPFLTNFTETPVAGGNTGTAKTIDLTAGTVQDFTLTGNCTFTMPTATNGKSLTVRLKTGTGGFTAAFTGVKWAGSTPVATTTAARMDVFFFHADGTNWYGSYVQNYTP